MLYFASITTSVTASFTNLLKTFHLLRNAYKVFSKFATNCNCSIIGMILLNMISNFIVQ